MPKPLHAISALAVAAAIVGPQAGTASASIVAAHNDGVVKITISEYNWSTLPGFSSLLGTLNKEYAGKYDFKFIYTPYNDFPTLMPADLTSGTEPDVTGASTDEAAYYAREGLELPIDPFLKAAGINPAEDEYISYTIVNGVDYSLPYFQIGTPLYYNKALFKKAGLNPNDPPTTGTQLVADALAMKKAGITYPIMIGVDKDAQDFPFPGLVYQFGGVMGDLRTCAALFDSKAGIAAATWEKNLIYKYHVEPAGVLSTETGADFAKGVVGMIIYPGGGEGSFAKAIGSGNLGVAPMPKVGPVNDDEFAGVGDFWVFRNAVTTSPKGQKGIGILLKAFFSQELPRLATYGALPTYKPALTGLNKTMPYFSQIYAMAERGVVNPAIPNWGTSTAVPLYNNLEDILLDKVSVSAGLQAAKVQTDELTKTLPGCSD